ncbi:MAG: alpha/beta hydrolase [Thermodesulfobacteriota bacterium]
MIDLNQIDFSELDRPEILEVLFHPRAEWGGYPAAQQTKDHLISVDKEAAIGARFHVEGITSPNILFFHGNGEIVSDYDDMGAIYNGMGINLLAVDYRGYGISTGTPTITAMMRDCHVLFDFVTDWLKQNRYSGKLVLMGRSLGSASALELAASYPDLIDALIVESGFAYSGPLLQLMGIQLDRFGFTEKKSFRNLEKIRKYQKPTLIIHAEFDHIIHFSEAQALYDASISTDKAIIKIPAANHNDIFLRGSKAYLTAIKQLLERL